MDVRAEVEKALDIAAKIAENPLAQSALGLAFVPPSVTAKVGELLQLLDLELAGMTKVTPVETPAAPDPTSAAVSGSVAAGSISAAPAPVEPADADPKAPSPSTGTTGRTGTNPPVFVPPQVGPPVA